MKRDSRFELLRIVAMFMVLVLHANFLVLHFPGTKVLHAYTLQAMTRISFEMLSLVAVNLFVMISGWWGIRPSLGGFAKFLFQSIFIISFMYGVGIATGKADFNIAGIRECVFFTQGWFVVTYAALYLLAPVLNSYVATVSGKSFKQLLIAFFAFQTIYGWMAPETNNISFGYSVFSFAGLYLLARYMRLYGQHLLCYGKWLWLGSLISSILLYAIPVWYGTRCLDYMVMAYSSPTTILGALGLLMMCANSRPWHSRGVNKIAASCFSVYLCHRCNLWTKIAYGNYAVQIYREHSGLNYLAIIALYMLAVFAVSILIDQLRKICWQIISNPQKVIYQTPSS